MPLASRMIGGRSLVSRNVENEPDVSTVSLEFPVKIGLSDEVEV